MIDIIINGKLTTTCLPELVPLYIQALVPNIGIEFSIQTKKHEEKAGD